MQDLCAYQIEVHGKVGENAFNATSPLQVKVVHADPDTTLFTISADQSGLIGLLRYLHQQGFVLLSVYRS
jgi:hypothetical protein